MRFWDQLGLGRSWGRFALRGDAVVQGAGAASWREELFLCGGMHTGGEGVEEGECSEGNVKISCMRYIVFLDIQMPRMSAVPFPQQIWCSQELDLIYSRGCYVMIQARG